VQIRFGLRPSRLCTGKKLLKHRITRSHENQQCAYSYQQLSFKKLSSSPWSKFNRHRWSKFNRRQQQGIDGNFYGVANFGGLNNATGTVFKITPNGEFTLLHTFTGGADGAFPSGSLLLGKDGDFYGTTAGQGAGEGTVFKITQTGVKTVLYTLKGAAEGRGSTSTPVMRSNGDLYGMTFMGGSNDFGVVFKLRP
jgi:uncharacterized repeat protein (TIGR03803 family)